MNKILIGFIFFLVSITAASAQGSSEPIRVEARPEKGFSYPYYLYVPAAIREQAAQKSEHSILVLPNNTGKIEDDFSIHEADVKKRILTNRRIGDMLKTAILTPVFPRPASDWKLYTHALDRDVMLTDKREYARLDRQLLAMIDDARERLNKEKLRFDKRVMIMGFSASGMFANRFTFLHPDRVKAAVIGSPGGWPIAPAASYKEKSLRYPIGTGDFKAVTGSRLKMKTLRSVPLFVFLGDKDDNDSVPFGDSYDDEDRELIMPLLGKKPIDRWEISRTLYKEAGLNAEFRLYPDVAHTVTKQMQEDIMAFLLKYK